MAKEIQPDEKLHMLIVDAGFGGVIILRKMGWRYKLKRIWSELINDYMGSISGETYLPQEVNSMDLAGDLETSLTPLGYKRDVNDKKGN